MLMPNGDVLLCCMDYGMRAPIGNLLMQTWEELDRGTIARLNLNDGQTICRNCHGAEACGP